MDRKSHKCWGAILKPTVIILNPDTNFSIWAFATRCSAAVRGSGRAWAGLDVEDLVEFGHVERVAVDEHAVIGGEGGVLLKNIQPIKLKK